MLSGFKYWRDLFADFVSASFSGTQIIDNPHDYNIIDSDVVQRVRSIHFETERLSISGFFPHEKIADFLTFRRVVCRDNADYAKFLIDTDCEQDIEAMLRYHSDERDKLLRDWAHIYARQGTHFIASDKDGGKPVVCYNLYKDSYDRYRLSYFCAKSERRKGFTSESYGGLAEALEACGITIAYAEAHGMNVASRSFLLSQGFRVAVGEYTPTREDHAPMIREP